MRNKLVLVAIQTVGYLWYFSMFLILIPYVLISLSQGFDFFLLNLIDADGLPTLAATFDFSVYNLFALVVFVFGLLIVLEATIELYQSAHTFPFVVIPHPSMQPKKLAQSGWYGRVRHPMILGYLIALIGIGIYLKLFTMAIWWVPILGIILVEKSRVTEEQELKAWFGKEYVDYCRKTPALLPRLKRDR